MGRKTQNKIKKNPQQHLQPPPNPSPPPSADAAAIKNLCEKALISLRKGKREAETEIQAAATRFPDSALVQRVRAKISLDFSEMYPNQRSKLLSRSLEAAKKATELSPQSIEYAHFLAKLMFDEAEREGTEKRYVNVRKECDRGLCIEDPIDPRTERVKGDGIDEKECSVENVRQELKELDQLTHIKMIQQWMKSHGCDDGRFMLNPVKKNDRDANNMNDLNMRSVGLGDLFGSEPMNRNVRSKPAAKEKQGQQKPESVVLNAGEGLRENATVDQDSNVNVNVESQDKNESLVESEAGEGSGVIANVDAVVNLGENVSVDLDANVNVNVESQDKNESVVELDGGEDSEVNVNVDVVVNANVRSQDKMDKATEYWDSLSDDMKKEFFSLRFSDLWDSLNDDMKKEFLSHRISDLWDCPDRSVLLLFVMSYLQARSEGSAEKDVVPAEDEPDPSNSNNAERDSSRSSKEDQRGKKPNQDSEATSHSEKLETATGVDSEHGDREAEPECPPETPKDTKSDGCEQDIMGTADGSITTSGKGN